MLKDLSFSGAFMGVIAGFIGFAGSFTVLIQGLKTVGANDAQVASAIMMGALSMGICSIALSLWRRIPIAIAWSFPAGALLSASVIPEGGFPVVIGALLICALLLTATGLFKPLGALVNKIPTPIASAMLAGILVNLCMAPARAIAIDPWQGLPLFLAWLIAGRIHKLLAVPAALLAFVIVVITTVDMPTDALATLKQSAVATPILTAPTFTVSALFSLAIPLYIVTMAGQNLPGLAAMKVNQYDKFNASEAIAVTGLASIMTSFFAAMPNNLAAITAALCAGEEAHKDPALRYWTSAMSGATYIVFALTAGAATTFISLSPPILIEAIAGLALIGSFAGAMVTAFEDQSSRQPAAITFLISASGISILDISGAFWGLLAGLIAHGLSRIHKSF